MKLKEFGPPGGDARPKFYYVDPPLHNYIVLVDSSAAQQAIGALPLSLDVHWLPREE